MNIKFNILAFFLSLLFACSKQDAPSNSNATTLSIGVNNSKNKSMSDYLLIKDVIVLKQNEEQLLGRVTKLSKTEEGYLIMDRSMSKAIFHYDFEGYQISKLTRNGKGPGEVGRVSDFWFDNQNKRLSILSINPNKKLVISEDGNFIEEEQLDFPALSYTQLRNGHDLYEIAGPKSDHHFLEMNDGQVTARIAENNTDMMQGKRFTINPKGGFKYSNNGYCILPNHSNIIYEFHSGQIKEAYILDLGRHTPFVKTAKAEEVAMNITMFRTKNHMIINYFLKEEGINTTILNIDSNSYTTGPLSVQSDKSVLNFAYWGIVYSDENEFIAEITNVLPDLKKSIAERPDDYCQYFEKFEVAKGKIMNADSADNVLVKFVVKEEF